jgi:hypothetical protein
MQKRNTDRDILRSDTSKSQKGEESKKISRESSGSCSHRWLEKAFALCSSDDMEVFDPRRSLEGNASRRTDSTSKALIQQKGAEVDDRSQSRSSRNMSKTDLTKENNLLKQKIIEVAHQKKHLEEQKEFFTILLKNQVEKADQEQSHLHRQLETWQQEDQQKQHEIKELRGKVEKLDEEKNHLQKSFDDIVIRYGKEYASAIKAKSLLVHSLLDLLEKAEDAQKSVMKKRDFVTYTQRQIRETIQAMAAEQKQNISSPPHEGHARNKNIVYGQDNPKEGESSNTLAIAANPIEGTSQNITSKEDSGALMPIHKIESAQQVQMYLRDGMRPGASEGSLQSLGRDLGAFVQTGKHKEKVVLSTQEGLPFADAISDHWRERGQINMITINQKVNELYQDAQEKFRKAVLSYDKDSKEYELTMVDYRDLLEEKKQIKELLARIAASTHDPALFAAEYNRQLRSFSYSTKFSEIADRINLNKYI